MFIPLRQSNQHSLALKKTQLCWKMWPVTRALVARARTHSELAGASSFLLLLLPA